ncbi:MAG: AcrR family transcriptional regulator [Candidatus Poriferisodalaceae bacterium]|jgi:AcrR family transcriptional regulator
MTASTTSATSSPPKTRRSRNDVVRTAAQLFAARGYHGTSMRDLGNELGLLGSSLYSHVGSKAELLVEVIAGAAVDFQQLAALVVEAGGGPAQQLEAIVRGHLDLLVANPDRALVFINESRFVPEPHFVAVVAMFDAYQAEVRALLADGRQQGVFAHDLDEHLTANLILSLLNGTVRWFRPDGSRTPTEIADELLRVVLAACGHESKGN